MPANAGVPVRLRKIPAVITGLLAGCAFPAWLVAATLYVDGPNGSDSATGLTPATAWRTIQRAANVVNPGDVVIIQPGLYAESVTSTRLGSPASVAGARRKTNRSQARSPTTSSCRVASFPSTRLAGLGHPRCGPNSGDQLPQSASKSDGTRRSGRRRAPGRRRALARTTGASRGASAAAEKAKTAKKMNAGMVAVLKQSLIILAQT